MDGQIYDAFLHKRDTSFSVPELHQWIKAAGLYFVDHDDVLARSKLDLDNHMRASHTGLADKIRGLPAEVREAMAEIVVGNLEVHSVWVSNIPDSEATVDDLDNVMFVRGRPLGLYGMLNRAREENFGNLSAVVSRCATVYSLKRKVDTRCSFYKPQQRISIFISSPSPHF